nr:leucine-rich repeat-containing protein 37A2-like [Anolis sagrei ordinatus]
MGPVATSNTHFFFLIALVSFARLDTANEPCPIPCRCTVEILNCSRTANPPGLHRVPFPKAVGHPPVFFFLDFTNNAISTIGTQAWRGYPWAEYLVLKGNSLTRLQNDSLDGLLSLTHLDLSCNKIRTIEKNAFEPVPFLQFVDLSGNVIGRITQGAFQAWHGMQFLIKLVLNHNQLTSIDDAYFYKLPSLKFLDLGATGISPNTLVELLKITLQLKTLVLPKKMVCCLCRIQDDIEVLCESIQLNCTESCDSNSTQCEKNAGLHKMQEEVMKILETRKQNSSNVLSIQPERPLQENTSLAMPVNQSLTHFGIHFQKLTPHLFTTVEHLADVKNNESLDIKWTDKSELKQLYMLAKLLQAELRGKIDEYQGKNEWAEASSGTTPAAEERVAPALQKKRHIRKVKRDSSSPNRKQPLLTMGKNKQALSKAVMQYAELPGIQDSTPRSQHMRKLSKAFKPLRPRHIAPHLSPWKRSISGFSTLASPTLTASILMDDDDDDELTGKVFIILKHGNKSRKRGPTTTPTPVSKQEEEAPRQYSQPESQPALPSLSLPSQNEPVGGNMENAGGRAGENVGGNIGGSGAETHGYSKEDLLNQLMHGGEKGKIPEDDLNQLSPDITLSHETHWEHHEPKTTVSSQLNQMKPQDDFLRKGDLFEVELNKRLATLIPNVPVRKLISHVIRILKMDCTEPAIQMACAKLISRTGLLMKLFSDRENIKETSPLWESYFWPVKNAVNKTKSSSRKIEKPSEEIARQGIPEYGYGNKILLAISVTAAIMLIILAIGLYEICSQRSREGGERRGFWGRKKGSVDEQSSATSSLDKPLWLKDTYQPLDETRRKSMVNKLHDAESSDEEDIFNWANARPPVVAEPLPAPKTSSVKLEAPPPSAEPPPVKKASSKKLAAPPADKASAEGSAAKKSGEEGSEAGTEEASKKASEGEGEAEGEAEGEGEED